MAVYENPNNQYREGVGFMSILGALFLGPVYYAFKGAWAHAIIHFLAVFFLWLPLIFTGIGAVIGLPILLVWWILYALAAPWIVGKIYLRQGWRRVD